MVTIKQIAEQLGISISTVSKGLNGASDISEETKQLVLDTAMELGYVARKKKSDAASKLCVLIKNMDHENINQFGYELITGFRMAATAKHISVTLLEASQLAAEPSFEALMRKRHFTGALVLGLTSDDCYLEEIKKTTIPTVLFDNYVDNPYVGCMATDNIRGVELAVEHLANLGHTKLGFVQDFVGSYANGRRRAGFESGARALKLPCEASQIQSCNTPEGTHDAVVSLLEQDVTGIICATDLSASRVLAELHYMEKRVPADVSVIGFDDLPIAKYLSPPLTTIRQDRLSLGKCALTLLEALENGISVSSMMIRPELVLRKSTAIPEKKD